MAKSVNKTFLLGHVGKNPEVGSTPGGIAANFSLATTDREKDRRAIGPTGPSGTTWSPTAGPRRSCAIT